MNTIYKKKGIGSRLLILLLALAMIMTAIPATAFAADGKTEIDSAAELAAIDGTSDDYILTGDIDLTKESSTWTSISSFSGTLDGNGYSITLNGAPIFDSIASSATVKNLVLEGSLVMNQGKPYYGNKNVEGTIAYTSAGTIRNCISYVALDDSDGSINTGGIVGYQSAGTIENCINAGTAKGSYYGICARTAAGTINNCWFSEVSYGESMAAVAYANNGGTVTNSGYESNMTSNTFLQKMNGNLADGDLAWVIKEDKLTLAKATGGADKTQLNLLISSVNGRNSKDYTTASWQNVATALASATTVSEKQDASAEDVTGAINTLQTAVDALVISTEYQEISTQAQLAKMDRGYYKLTSDITLSDWNKIASFKGTLDGNGHTITITDVPLFEVIESSAVIKNLILGGTYECSAQNDGVMAVTCAGTIRNCISKVAITGSRYANNRSTGGFVGSLSGSISKSIFNGSYTVPPTGSNAFAVNGGSETTVTDSYYNSESGAPAGSYRGDKTSEQLKSAEFIASMNANRQEGDLKWVAGTDGFPIPTVVTDIDTVSIKIAAPVGGKALDKSVECTDDKIASVSDASWTANGAEAAGNALYNTEYTVSVTLTAKDAYEFTEKSVVEVNGEQGVVSVNQDETATVTYSFSTAKEKLVSITAPKAITVANGTSYSAMGLPSTVAIITDGGSYTSAKVTWNTASPVSGSYNKKTKTAQKVVLSGTVECPSNVDANGVALATTITVTIKAAKAKINLNYSKLPLQKGKSTKAIKIKTKTFSDDAIKSAKSSNTKIATVSVKKGVLTVKGKKKGTVTITVTSKNGAKDTVKVTVKNKVNVSKLTLNYKSKQLKKGKKLTLKVTKNPVTATNKITWKSSNTKIATVNSKGVVKAKKKGTVKITATSSNGKKVTCKIKVK